LEHCDAPKSYGAPDDKGAPNCTPSNRQAPTNYAPRIGKPPPIDHIRKAGTNVRYGESER
jgi:hypothetical protein